MDILLIPDPEIETEEVECNKRTGKEEENDIFRDLNLFKILTSSTKNIPFQTWLIQHVERFNIVIPAGI